MKTSNKDWEISKNTKEFISLVKDSKDFLSNEEIDGITIDFMAGKMAVFIQKKLSFLLLQHNKEIIEKIERGFSIKCSNEHTNGTHSEIHLSKNEVLSLLEETGGGKE
jgi:hypothetical protein